MLAYIYDRANTKCTRSLSASGGNIGGMGPWVVLWHVRNSVNCVLRTTQIPEEQWSKNTCRLLQPITAAYAEWAQKRWRSISLSHFPCGIRNLISNTRCVICILRLEENECFHCCYRWLLTFPPVWWLCQHTLSAICGPSLLIQFRLNLLLRHTNRWKKAANKNHRDLPVRISICN